MENYRGTTICSVRRGNMVVMGGDGQVTLGDQVQKHGAVKVRALHEGRVLAGFAGGAADALALLDRFEAFPITRDQLRMLMEGNTCSTHDLEGLGIEPLAFDEQHLAYLRETTQDSTAWQKNAA